MMDARSRRLIHWNTALTNSVVVGALVLLLATIVIPAILQARDAARRTHSKNNLKQIRLALHNYHDAFQMFPFGGMFDGQGRAYHGWVAYIMPFMESSPWYSECNFNFPWNDPRQIDHFQRMTTEAFSNPNLARSFTPDGFPTTHYSVSDLVCHRNSSTAAKDILSGLSTTFLLGDAAGDFEPFGYPRDWRDASLGMNQSSLGFGCSVHGGAMMVMVDGSLREFGEKTDQSVFTAMRGKSSKNILLEDVAKPDYAYRVSEPLVNLWSDSKTGSALIGWQDEFGRIMQAWLFNSRETSVEKPIQLLTQLRQLEWLQLQGPSMTDSDFEKLEKCVSLKTLELRSADITDRGWRSLDKLPKLQSVDVDFGRFVWVSLSPRAVVEFHRRRPDCQLRFRRGKEISLRRVIQLADQGSAFPVYEWPGK